METNINSPMLSRNNMLWPFKEKREQKQYAIIMVFFGIILLLLKSFFYYESLFYILGVLLSCFGLMYMFEAVA
ncbi:hypothetical protein HYY69_03865 [Candidatus Woesearchaeota archaeon]|nr:hypothetical protein [Candidatus Woesearchaeota archaeon]